MWLPMEFSLSRNVTYDKIRKGQLQNIRLNTVSMLLPFDENITSQNFGKPYHAAAAARDAAAAAAAAAASAALRCADVCWI